MRKPSPNIYVVAKEAGVSIATVSRLLNDPEKVSPKTRRAILAAIEKTGYVPHPEARTRGLKEHRRIGVITPFFAVPSFVQRLRGLAFELVKTKYDMVIYTVDTAERMHNYLLTLPLTGGVDGIIITSLEFSRAEAEWLVQHKLETVLIEYPQEVFSTVEIDNIAGGEMAVQYLAQKGHRRIAFMGDPDLPEYSVHPVGGRLVGFRKGMEEAGLEVKPQQVIHVEKNPHWASEEKIGFETLLQQVSMPMYILEKTRQVTCAMMQQSQPPTAIFAATDLQAIGAVLAAREIGLQVPGDLAVIGFDDLDVAAMFGLTTIRQHLDESGKVAAELLIARLEDRTRPLQHINLPLKLIERNTA